MTDEQIDQLARDLFDEIMCIIAVVIGGIPLDVQQHAKRQCEFGIRRVIEKLTRKEPDASCEEADQHLEVDAQEASAEAEGRA